MKGTQMIPPGTTLPGGDSGELTSTELDAWRGMLRVTHHLRRELGQELTEQHHLSMADYDALVVLAGQPDHTMRMAQLAEEILQPRSSLTRIIGSLERRGLVCRVPTPEDARGSAAQLTRSGRGAFARAHRTHLQGIRRLFLSRLSDVQLDHLAHAWADIDPRAVSAELDDPAS